VRVGTDDARGSDLTAVNINLPNREALKEAVPDIEEQMNAWHLKIDPVATNCTNPTTVEVTQDYEEKGRVEAKLKQGCDYSVVLALGKKKSNGTPTPPPKKVTYDTDIKPLIAKACLQCHGEGATLPPLHNWDAVKVSADGVFNTVVVKKTMPKTGVLDDDSLNLVTKWKDDGYLEKSDRGTTPDADSGSTPDPDAGDPDAPTPPPGGGTTPDPVVTYENSVKSVLDQGCATSNCHDGKIPPALNGWDVVKVSAQRILVRAAKDKTMPPGVPLKDADLEILKSWEKDGFKEKVEGTTEADVDGPLESIYYQNNEPLTIKRTDIEGKAEFKAALKLNLQDAGRAIGLGKK
jgi:hypothetical protein